MLEVKHIRGKGFGTRMDWLCVVHEGEGFGFGGKRAITCVDMTVHAPEHGRPNTVISTYMRDYSLAGLRHDFIKGAYDTIEQVAFAKEIIDNWDKIKSGEEIDLDKKANEIRFEWKKPY